MKEVYTFLNSLKININDPIIVAVSYGPDSMFLLDMLRKRYSNIVCAHVHHNHRKESDIEKIKLQEYCLKNNIIFEFKKIDSYKNNRFTEEEARKIRYAFFEELIKKYNSNYLFTAHHGDDLIETVMMRLVRGSSLNGYSGIKLISKRSDYSIIRPLLFLDKEYIMMQCEYKAIPYNIDVSNDSNLHTRNRYRKSIIPFLKQENKNVHLKFLKFSNMIQEYDDYITNIVTVKYNGIIKNKVIDINELKKEDLLIIKKIISNWLYNTYQSNIDEITSKNLEDIINIIKSNKANSRLDLPLGKVVIKSYNKLSITKSKQQESFLMELKDGLLLPNNYLIRIADELDDTSNYVTALNTHELKLPLFFRNRKNGDVIEVLGMSGKKKIKDIFIDEKIGLCFRDNYPILVDSNDTIIWLPGLKKSKYDKSKQGNYDIIIKCCREEYNETTK